MRMDGRATFRAAVAAMSDVTQEVVSDAGLALEEIDLFVYHQANSRIISAVGERLDLPSGRVIDCLAEYGNTSAASIPIALSEAVDGIAAQGVAGAALGLRRRAHLGRRDRRVGGDRMSATETAASRRCLARKTECWVRSGHGGIPRDRRRDGEGPRRAKAGRWASTTARDRDGRRGDRRVDRGRGRECGHGRAAMSPTWRPPSKMLSEVTERLGPVLVLVNNAGVTADGLSMRLSDEDWDRVLEVNLTAAFRLTRSVVGPMMRQRFGRVINVSSVVGLRANAGQANYAASKAGLIAFTRTVAVEVARRGVTVNAVAPGLIETELTRDFTSNGSDSNSSNGLLDAIPARRTGSPEEVAACIRFLASDEASYVTGAVLPVDGGMSA